MDVVIKLRFDDLLCDLSPEHLASDGEASYATIQRRKAEITEKWAALEKLVGRKVSEEEARKFWKDPEVEALRKSLAEEQRRRIQEAKKLLGDA